MGLEMPFFFLLLNASYMIMFRSFFCIKDRRGQNTGMGAGKQTIWRGHGFLHSACIPCREGPETVCIIKYGVVIS
jgi:hypothetical protein